ncbi:MAG TPA: hypothetical protein DCM45_04845 [Clostridiales bacterium]|nr:hypothetical protein [Clostridiales bacterium]
MVFSSPTFLFLFLPVVFALHALVPRRYRNVLLLLASLIFYGWGEPVFVLVMVLSALANYLLALGIDRCLRQRITAAEHSWLLAVCRMAGAVAVFIICLLSLSTSAYNPFIYFRF